MTTTAAQKIWQAMRGLQRFTYNELEVITGCGYKVLRNKMSLFLAAGYVKITGHSGPFRVFTLVKNTGPKAPVRCSCLYDPNTDKFMRAKPKDARYVD